jgi:hypothetical protein
MPDRFAADRRIASTRPIRMEIVLTKIVISDASSSREKSFQLMSVSSGAEEIREGGKKRPAAVGR